MNWMDVVTHPLAFVLGLATLWCGERLWAGSAPAGRYERRGSFDPTGVAGRPRPAAPDAGCRRRGSGEVNPQGSHFSARHLCRAPRPKPRRCAA